MNAWDETEGSERDRARARRNANYATGRQTPGRQMARAVAEREQGKRRLSATTVGVSFASVVAAGVVLAVLPGSTHSSVTGNPAGKTAAAKASGSGTTNTSKTSKSSNSSSDSGSSNSNSNSNSNSSNSSNSGNSSNSSSLQQPVSQPVSVSGGGSVSSGGS
jgi:hypothetical protein